jgi:hypothetical protein
MDNPPLYKYGNIIAGKGGNVHGFFKYLMKKRKIGEVVTECGIIFGKNK